MRGGMHRVCSSPKVPVAWTGTGRAERTTISTGRTVERFQNASLDILIMDKLLLSGIICNLLKYTSALYYPNHKMENMRS
jgi:hypothetical protein